MTGEKNTGREESHDFSRAEGVNDTADGVESTHPERTHPSQREKQYQKRMRWGFRASLLGATLAVTPISASIFLLPSSSFWFIHMPNDAITFRLVALLIFAVGISAFSIGVVSYLTNRADLNKQLN